MSDNLVYSGRLSTYDYKHIQKFVEDLANVFGRFPQDEVFDIQLKLEIHTIEDSDGQGESNE